jgi:hypothetical protein
MRGDAHTGQHTHTTQYFLGFYCTYAWKGHLTINKEICINADERYGANAFHIDSHIHILKCLKM